MVLDKIENINLYKGLSKRLDTALNLLTTEDFVAKKDGKYEVDSDNIFYMVQRYETMPIEEGKFEAHRKYIDIQVVVSGSEIIGYAPIAALKTETDYSTDGDCELFNIPQKFTSLQMTKGMFSILWPKDGHMPCRIAEKSEPVCKVVIKIKLED